VTRAVVIRWLASFCAVALVVAAGRVARAQPPRRLALIVGANGAPPGRSPLRYSHEDAQRVAEVLVGVAGFNDGDVSVLLDPQPQTVLDALDRLLREAEAASREAVLFFYYSGHADDAALYPAGRTLRMADLKPRLEDPRAKVRIGIIDSCRGGGWTGTKGLTAAEPFDVNVPLGLSNEGSILIASSSGLENAHESEALRGSFFTHHWNGGLMGAADRNGDGRVTMSEAFEYARTLTIRDTALVTQTPQHPSFHMNLSGRQDFTLASVPSRGSALMLEQSQGPLELVNLDSGLVVLESARGRTVLRLAVTPGRYLVRRRDPSGIWAREVEVPPDGQAHLSEEQLLLARPSGLAAKDAVPRIDSAPVVPPGHWALAFNFGVRHARVMDPGLRLTNESGDILGILRAAYGFAPDWHAVLPLAVAHAGRWNDDWRWVAWGGLPVLGARRDNQSGTVITGALGAGFDFQRAVGTGGDLDWGMSVLGAFNRVEHQVESCLVIAPPDHCTPLVPTNFPPDTWTVQLTAGYTHRLAEVVTLNLAVAVAGNALASGDLPTLGWREPSFDPLVAIGAVQRRGLLPQPLIRVDVSETMALDVYAAVAYQLATRTITESYLGGASWAW
jgi:hypothetical protein